MSSHKLICIDGTNLYMKIIQEYLNEANIFKDILSDVRKKGKDLIQKLSKKAASELEKDMKEMGSSLQMSKTYIKKED